MKKVLFIDRDGTLVIEPKIDYQVDSLEKLEFYPGVFQWLARIATELEYELVMVTNQDGLGTDSFPEDKFWTVQHKIMQALKNEGIVFSEVYIDRTMPEEHAPTRKPGTGLLGKYIHGNYDLSKSYVIGDRLSDVNLANNLNANAILIGSTVCEKPISLSTTSWSEIYYHLKKQPRTSKVHRQTKETAIQVALNLDGTGKSRINTKIGFLNHLLDQLTRHGYIDIQLEAKGDLHIDEHHTIEDIAISLGQTFHNALGDKKGIERYGFMLPMDDCLAQVAVDFGGRPWLTWQAEFNREKIGEMPTEMFKHFFKSFSDSAKCNLNIKAEGENEHHKIEAIFKAFAKAISMAIAKNKQYIIPSTKGIL